MRKEEIKTSITKKLRAIANNDSAETLSNEEAEYIGIYLNNDESILEESEANNE